LTFILDWKNKGMVGRIKILMVRRSTFNQKVVNCGGALLECPHAAVDLFNIINGGRTKQMTHWGGLIQ